jgi:hypothetical protein
MQKGTRIYIQNQAREPQKPLQGLDGDPILDRTLDEYHDNNEGVTV